MWCKLRLKSFTLPGASWGRKPKPLLLSFKMYSLLTKALGCNSALLPYCSLWTRLLCFVAHTHTQEEWYISWNFYCYFRAARGKTTACWFWGKRGSAERTLLLHCFPAAWTTQWRDAVSRTGHLTAYMERWPSLRRDQGITLNPPDRCHMHARAHKHTEKQKWWRERGGERRGSKRGRYEFAKKSVHSHTQSSVHCLYCYTSACVQIAHMVQCHARFPTMHMGYCSIWLHLNTLSPPVCVTRVASMCRNTLLWVKVLHTKSYICIGIKI